MKHLTLAALVLAACAAGAPALANPADAMKHKLAHCSDCGTVQAVNKEKRKGEGGAVGIVAGAAAGGLLGNQVGGGTGKALATVGGAVAGGFVGNEVQKHVTSKDVWVTKVKLKDGTVKTFEQAQAPGWKAGSLVKVQGKALASL
jgi:outer membrane lipoprotein SlyB